MEYQCGADLLQAEDITAYSVRGNAERFYKFGIAGVKYFLPADQVLKELYGTRKLDAFINAPVQDISLYKPDFNWDPAFGVGVFCGVPWYLDFSSYTLKPFPSDVTDTVMRLFYGTTDFPDTIDAMLHFKQFDLRDNNGKLVKSSYLTSGYYSWGIITPTRLESDRFVIGDKNFITTATGEVAETITLYFDGRLIKNDITAIHRLAGGMLLQDVDDDITFINYKDITANIVHIFHNVFWDNGFVYSIFDDTFVRIPVAEPIDFNTVRSGQLNVGGTVVHYAERDGRVLFSSTEEKDNSPIDSVVPKKIAFGEELHGVSAPITPNFGETQNLNQCREIDITKMEEVMYDTSLIL